MPRVPETPEAWTDAVRALAARMDADHATSMSPGGFDVQQGRWTYEPPPLTENPLYVAPEVAALDAPPSPTTEQYEAAMCLRSVVEGEARIERRFVKETGATDLADAWARYRRDASVELPRPAPKAYKGLGQVGVVLDAMTRRDPARRLATASGLEDLAGAVHAAPPPEPARLLTQVAHTFDRKTTLVGLVGLALGVLLGLLIGIAIAG